MPLRKVVCQAAYLIDCELDLIQMDLEHPERFIEFPSANPPIVRWKGKIAELLEYGLAPWYAGKVLKPSGEPMDYAEVIRSIENTYGIKVPGAYDRKTDILTRRNPALFLEKLVTFLKTEAKKIIK